MVQPAERKKTCRAARRAKKNVGGIDKKVRVQGATQEASVKSSLGQSTARREALQMAKRQRRQGRAPKLRRGLVQDNSNGPASTNLLLLPHTAWLLHVERRRQMGVGVYDNYYISTYCTTPPCVLTSALISSFTAGGARVMILPARAVSDTSVGVTGLRRRSARSNSPYRTGSEGVCCGCRQEYTPNLLARETYRLLRRNLKSKRETTCVSPVGSSS